MHQIKLFLIILFINSGMHSQIQNPSPNLKPKKIRFTYVQVPNFYFEKNKVYADSTTLSKEFQNTKINFTKSPLDSSKTIAYVHKKDIRLEDLNNFRSKIFHDFTEINYEYKVKSNTLIYSGSICKSDVCKKVFTDFFDDPKMVGTDIILCSVAFYDKEQTIVYYPLFGSTKISYKDNIVTWSTQFPDVGTFNYLDSHNKTVGKKISSIFVDFNLDKHITPTTLFSNCEFGVKQIRSSFKTVILTKVKYKY